MAIDRDIAGRAPARGRADAHDARAGRRGASRWALRWRGPLVGGGSDGNEHLTVVTGALLIVLLLVIGVTILRIKQLISVHLFVGLLLVGPIALKLASTGYRFVRYYTHAPIYRDKGPPHPIMRALAPLLVILTIAVLASGLVLLFLGPSARGQWVSIHKVTFIAWVILAGVHILGHLPEMSVLWRGGRHTHAGLRAQGLYPEEEGKLGRGIALAGGLVVGLVLAVILLPQFGAWTHAGAFPHHDHHGSS